MSLLENIKMDNFQNRKRKNQIMFGLTAVFAFLAVSNLLAIIGYIFFKGASSINFDFITKLPKPVGETGGGIANSIWGSTKIVGLASGIGIPVGVLGAVYLAEFGAKGKFGFWIRYSADVLNGVPSIVVGIFAYSVAVLPFRQFSAVAGAFALSIIMIPLVLRNTEEFIKLVPNNLREGALALGVPRWKVILRIVLPTASRGIMTGAILAISRIAGETAPLLFTAFGNRFWSESIFEPTASLPLTIFTYAIAPYEDWHQQAWASALILLFVVLIGNVIARFLIRSKGQSR